MTRDMTERQFKAALKKHGFGGVGPMGYVQLPDSTCSVSLLNANSDSYRDMLAYLLREAAKDEARRVEAGDA